MAQNISLDFSSIPSREAIPEGVYNVICETAELKESKNHKPMISARFKEPQSGSSIFENFVLTPDCLWKLKEFCKAVGMDTEGVTDAETIIQMMPGIEVQVKVVQEEYEGQSTNRIKKYLMG